jgi:hypothetical protein
MNHRPKWLYLAIAALAIVLIPLAGFFLVKGNPLPHSGSPSITPTITDGGENAPESGEYLNYISEDGNWQMDYWNELDVSERSASELGPDNIGVGSVNFSKVGPTQAEGTEFYDGLSINVGVVKKGANESIEQYADRKTQSQDPNLPHDRKYFRAVEINGHKGYEAYVEAYGNYTMIFLEYPVLKDRVYQISIISVGPDKEQYDSVWRKMVNSFKSYR